MLTKENLTLAEMLDFDKAYEQKSLDEEGQLAYSMECHEYDILAEIWRKRRKEEDLQYRRDILNKNSAFFASFDEK